VIPSATAYERVQLQQAIDEWASAGGIDGAGALSFTLDYPCNSSTDVRVDSDHLGASQLAVTSGGYDRITFNVDKNWWYNDSLPQQSGEYSYQGILTHEMGHAFGLHHTGDTEWSDDVEIPVMNACTTASLSVGMEHLAMDDWGAAVNVAAHATGKTPFFSANPGFEAGLAQWRPTDSSITIVTGANPAVKTGAKAARLGSINDYLYAGILFDPYIMTTTQSVSSKMVAGSSTNQVQFTMRADFRHEASGTTGGLRMKFNERTENYGPPSSNGCKDSAPHSAGPFLGQVTVGTDCPDPGTSWTPCQRAFFRYFPTTSSNQDDFGDARMFRPVFLSTSTGAMRLDRAGIYGGTSS
jgi:hypothetical protein